MSTSKERLIKASQKTLDTTRDVLQASLESVERLAKTNFDASRRFLEETSQTLKEISLATNPKEIFEKIQQLATNTVTSNVYRYKNLYEILANTQEKVARMLEEHISYTQQSVSNITETISHSNENNLTVTPIGNWLKTANQAMDAMQSVAQQVTDLTKENINVVKNSVKGSSSSKKATSK